MYPTNKKLHKVVLEYNVQCTYYVKAKSEDDAEQKALKGKCKVVSDNWEYTDTIESGVFE